MRLGETWEDRARELARRAGLGGVSPSVFVVCVVVLLLGVVLAAWRFWPQRPSTTAAASEGGVRVEQAAPAGASESRSAASAEATGSTAWVHVVGAVRRPGVYEVPSGARVAQAMHEAGGLLGNAAAEGVNLARPVTDGEQIVVPTRTEFEKAGGVGAGAANATGAGAVAGAGGTAAGASAASPIDINSADVTALDSLPGVGPATAQKIVADRQANGPYSSPEDLGRVPGIGPRKLESFKGLISAK